MLVELHWRPSAHFAAEIPVEALFSRSSTIEVGGASTRQMDPHDELIFLAVHAASHLFQRDVLLLDLRRLLEISAIDWPTLERRAREFKVARVVASALGHAEDRA